MHYDQVQGVFHATYDAKTFTYTDVYPALLRAALGSVDTVGASVAVTNVSGASAVGYPHTIGLINTPNQGSQPPSYTIINDSVDNTYQMTGSQESDFTLTLGADAAVELTTTWITAPYTIAASVSANESTAYLVPAWNCTASVGGSAVSVIENFELDIKRNAAPIFTLGTQAPYRQWAGAIEVSGKLTFVVELGTNYNALALERDQMLLQLQITDPVTSYYSYFQMSAAQLEDPVITVGKSYLTLETNYTAVANTIDAINGYAPILTKTYNSISGTY